MNESRLLCMLDKCFIAFALAMVPRAVISLALGVTLGIATPTANAELVFNSSTNVSVIEGSTTTGYFATATANVGDVLTYSISGGEDFSLFHIDPVTGELSFLAAPNYYFPADLNLDNKYTLELLVTNGLLDATLNFEVKVEINPPNILFIAIDDLNDWVDPFEGHPDTITPYIAQIASRGVRFTNAHASGVVCVPSRTSLLTGLAPSHTGVVGDLQQPMRPYVGDEVITIFQHFLNHDYYVAGAGKLFHGQDNLTEPWSELSRPYGRPQPAILPYHGLQELLDEVSSQFDWGPGDGQVSEWKEYKLATYSEEFLSRVHEKPFLLGVGFHLPHLPWYVPQEYWDKFSNLPLLPPYLINDRDDMPGFPQNQWAFDKEAHRIITEGGKWHEAVRAYLASINFVDDQVGRVLAALDSSDYANNTIIVLWSDHGYHLGEKDAWRKSTLWEESTHVPVIIVAPRIAPPDTNTDQVVSLLDLYPTLVELAGLPPDTAVDGVSLMPLLMDPMNGSRSIDYAITSHARGDAIRTNRWRYIRYVNGDEELYDHDGDPNEHVNLADLPSFLTVKQSLADKLDIATTWPDTDGDGIGDFVEGTTVDSDNDGTLDYLDTDSDDNGILDSVESRGWLPPVDTDGDGTYDFQDVDNDNDGVDDAIEIGSDVNNPLDFDSDGIPDYLDANSIAGVLGDINLDGNVNAGDLLLMLRQVLLMVNLTPIQVMQADVYPTSGDGSIDIRDLIILNKILMNL